MVVFIQHTFAELLFVPGTVLSAGDTTMNQTNQNLLSDILAERWKEFTM